MISRETSEMPHTGAFVELRGTEYPNFPGTPVFGRVTKVSGETVELAVDPDAGLGCFIERNASEVFLRKGMEVPVFQVTAIAKSIAEAVS